MIRPHRRLVAALFSAAALVLGVAFNPLGDELRDVFDVRLPVS